jgi:hypothetical protein
MTDLELLQWVREQTDADLPLGEFHGSTEYGHPQREFWSCGGCDGKGESVWPRWELTFNHEPGCKWLAFKQRTDPHATPK